MSSRLWHKPLYSHPAAGSLLRPQGELAYLRVEAANHKGIAHLQLNRAPVNSLSRAVLQELAKWLLWLSSDLQTKAVVISSAIPGVFSGGLDFVELSHPTPEGFAAFWGALQEMWLILNTFPKPVVTAVTGNSPAGGCVIALTTDYRVMTRGRDEGKGKPYIIGLNETQLGVVAPPWATAAYVHVIGARKAELLLQKGATPTAEEALAIGLVDEVHDTDADCLAAAFKQAAILSSVDPQARTVARDIARHAYLQPIASKEAREHDTEAMAALVLSDRVQGVIDAYTASISTRGKK